jgi:cell division protein FtsL
MLTFIIIVAVVAIAIFVAMKTGKVADTNNNNIPDAIETKVEEVKEVVADVKAAVAKVTKAPKAKTNAPKKTKK